MKLSDFFPHLLIELPGISDPLLNQALLRVAIDFCQRSQAWVEITEPLPLRDRQSEYDLDAPTDARVFLVREVWVGSRPLTPATIQRLQLSLPEDRSVTYAEPTLYQPSVDRQSLTLYPTPVASTAKLVAKVCYVPKANAATLPELLSERYLMAVCAGTKASLMAIPGQAWSNPALSAFYRSQFEDGIVTAKVEAFYDGAPSGQITVAPRPFGF